MIFHICYTLYMYRELEHKLFLGNFEDARELFFVLSSDEQRLFCSYLTGGSCDEAERAVAGGDYGERGRCSLCCDSEVAAA